jgi:hypothetical protein
MKHLLFAIFQVICCTTLFASEPIKSALIFQKTTHDFGHIDEERGIVTCKFDGVNTSNSTIEVLKIATTCGCTTAKYSQKVVEAGENFSFEVTFNPLGRPGRIEKEIFLLVSDSPHEIKLGITGYVNARERTIYELYPFDMGGGFRLKSNFHAFGYLEHGKEITERIGYVNTSESAISLDIIQTDSSGFLTIEYPKHIEAGASGDIVLHYAISDDSTIYGTKRDAMQIVVNGVEAYYPLTAQVVMVDNFDNTDDISAPKLAISKNIIKFGDVNYPNDVVDQRITLTNEGAEPLIIRAMECSTKAVECPKEEITIAPGASREVTIRLHAAAIEDIDNPMVARVYIICNDPLRPMQTLRVNAIPR